MKNDTTNRVFNLCVILLALAIAGCGTPRVTPKAAPEEEAPAESTEVKKKEYREPFFSFLKSKATRKLDRIQYEQMSAQINLPNEKIKESSFRTIDTVHIEKDTMVVKVDGKDVAIMRAIKDESTGEMVATQELRAAVVTARFRNVAERHGKIDLAFDIRVPKEMQDPKWQLRFYPDMYIMGDSLRLDNVYITGNEYRRAQLKGYEQYERWLRKIITDSTKFVNIKSLETFLERNIPQIYQYRTDSTYVSDEIFESNFGVSERMAIEHYTDKFRKNMNERRKARRNKMYARFVKAPIVTEHIRLDTVLVDSNGDFIYNYVQTINTRKGLRKVDIVLSGDIYEADRRLYVIPPTSPLTFYISSLSSFTDGRPKYRTKIIERRAEANAFWNVDFKVGKADIDESLGKNAAMIGNIKDNLRNLLVNEVYDLDSITIAAFASPEGGVAANKTLSEKRARAAVEYFDAYVKYVQDSVKREAGMSITIGDDMASSGMTSAAKFNVSQIRFKTSASGENWDYLNYLVLNDEQFTEEEKERYRKVADLVENLDARELELKKQPVYGRLRNEMYPLLRTVQFNFFLHRKGMVKDTVHTTELDTTYMRGVQMLADRDYEGAVALLGPYNDYNAAIAYVSLDRNLSALRILEKLPKTPQVNYMLAVVYSRQGDDQKAVECYLNSCHQDGTYVHRGNLDPEIAALIRKYNLNAQPEDDFGDLGLMK